MKPMLAILLTAVFAASPASAQGGEGAERQWVAAAFKSLCFDPFGDEAAVKSAVASFPNVKFKEIETRPGEPRMGTAWEAPEASLHYSSAEWLPRDLPSPQCTLTVETGAGADHAATAAALQAMLPVGQGKTKGKVGRQTTEWNFTGPGNARRRLFLSSLRAGQANQARVSLLNLRK